MNDTTSEVTRRVRRHLVFGWSLILVFLTLGLTLEYLHGVKSRLLLDVSNETRRLMWRLAHSHGALMGVLHVAFAATLYALRDAPPRRYRLVSGLLAWATILLPLGFFLGGIKVYQSDPWIGIFLSPIGALLLLLGVLLLVLGLRRPS